jgi:hypothetical protein
MGWHVPEKSVSEDLLPLYRQMAAEGANFMGLSILQHAEVIGTLVKRHGARKLLDYGCGRGDAYREPHFLHRQWKLRWFDVTLYDPAFPEHDEAPYGRYDGVLCSDVLEHVYEDEVDTLIAALFKHAKVFVWASVCCREAKKFFPDGVTNLHVTVKPMDWWREKFQDHSLKNPDLAVYLTETP